LLEVWSVARKYAFNPPKYAFILPPNHLKQQGTGSLLFSLKRTQVAFPIANQIAPPAARLSPTLARFPGIDSRKNVRAPFTRRSRPWRPGKTSVRSRPWWLGKTSRRSCLQKLRWRVRGRGPSCPAAAYLISSWGSTLFLAGVSQFFVWPSICHIPCHH
jgi:hypothetical protein